MYKKLEKLNNHPWINTAVIIVAGKIHQWMLKFMDKSMMRNRTFA